jgi:hypothetical protein
MAMKSDKPEVAEQQQPGDERETTLIPMLIWGLILIIIGMVFAVLIS